jgi:hypothetical protein
MKGFAMMTTRLLALLALAASASGCIEDHKPAQSPTPEYSEQEDYANTPTTGPGAESSGSYYGVSNSETPQHQPAKASQGGHQPY